MVARLPELIATFDRLRAVIVETQQTGSIVQKRRRRASQELQTSGHHTSSVQIVQWHHLGEDWPSAERTPRSRARRVPSRLQLQRHGYVHANGR